MVASVMQWGSAGLSHSDSGPYSKQSLPKPSSAAGETVSACGAMADARDLSEVKRVHLAELVLTEDERATPVYTSIFLWNEFMEIYTLHLQLSLYMPHLVKKKQNTCSGSPVRLFLLRRKIKG